MNEKERSLLQQIGRTGRAMYAAFETEVGHALPRWRILQALREQGGATQKQLAQALSMDPGALTRQMKALESEGLVTRQSDPADNRLTAVTLTAAGAALIEATQPLRRAFAKKALKGLPDEQVDIAMAVLKTLEERFRRMHGA
jgi:DNA-binding MarR family transcriptional regulator